MLLEKLSMALGASGNEQDVAQCIKAQIHGSENALKTDSSGNLIGFKPGNKKSHRRKIMIAAHMDEVGFMISGVNVDGTLHFVDVGGIDPRILPGCPVLIGKQALAGIIREGAKLDVPKTTKNLRRNLVIDFGATSIQDACKHVRLGDYVHFQSEFRSIENRTIIAKALDDRAGCAVILEAMQDILPVHDIYPCFTVCEEIGMLGAKVAASQVKPDLAIIIEGTTCNDMLVTSQNEFSTLMGQGSALSILDKSTSYDRDVNADIAQIAAENKLPIQFKKTLTGGNDSGAIQRSNLGTKVAVISMPVRYLHAPYSMMALSDYENTVRLLKANLETDLPIE